MRTMSAAENLGKGGVKFAAKNRTTADARPSHAGDDPPFAQVLDKRRAKTTEPEKSPAPVAPAQAKKPTKSREAAPDDAIENDPAVVEAPNPQPVQKQDEAPASEEVIDPAAIDEIAPMVAETSEILDELPLAVVESLLVPVQPAQSPDVENAEAAPIEIDETAAEVNGIPIYRLAPVEQIDEELEVAPVESPIDEVALEGELPVFEDTAAEPLPVEAKPDAPPKPVKPTAPAPVDSTPPVVRPELANADVERDQQQSSERESPRQPSAVELPEILADHSLAGAAPVAEFRAAPISSEPAHTPDTTPLNVAAFPTDKPAAPTVQNVAPAPPAPAPESIFGQENHSRIVQSIRTNLLPNGGTMQIRLDPPELGAINVIVRMNDGVMSASFETSNDKATRLLSHSLSDMRHTLEASGVTIDKLHVEQSPRDQQAKNQTSEDGRQQRDNAHDSPARREQERREILERMWKKLTEGSDPLDLVA